MTDRLSELLHTEGDLLEVPPAPTGAIIAAGRSSRARARAGRAVAVLAAAAVVAGGVGGALALTGRSGPGEPAPSVVRDLSAAAAFEQQGAFAVGRTVYFGTSGEHTAEVPADVKQLYYTAAGVLVRSGKSPWTDSAGPSDYGLVTPTATCAASASSSGTSRRTPRPASPTWPGRAPAPPRPAGPSTCSTSAPPSR